MFDDIKNIVIKKNQVSDKKVCKDRSQCRTTHKRKDC